jgi:hypothetical protein
MREGAKIVPRRFGAIALERTISLPHPEGYNTKIFIARRITSPLRQVDMKKFL